jgi:hypothetical protein
LVAPLARTDEASRKLADAVSELLDNAVRHASGGTVRLTLCIDAESGDFRVQTENHAHPQDIERLAARLALMRARGSREAYRALLVDAAERGLDVGLGLARLAGEVGVRLASRIVGGCVQVVAASRVACFLPAITMQTAERTAPYVYLAHSSNACAVGRDGWREYGRLLVHALQPAGEVFGTDSAPWERVHVEEIETGVRVRSYWARGEA